MDPGGGKLLGEFSLTCAFTRAEIPMEVPITPRWMVLAMAPLLCTWRSVSNLSPLNTAQGTIQTVGPDCTDYCSGAATPLKVTVVHEADIAKVQEWFGHAGSASAVNSYGSGLIHASIRCSTEILSESERGPRRNCGSSLKPEKCDAQN